MECSWGCGWVLADPLGISLVKVRLADHAPAGILCLGCGRAGSLAEG